MITDIVAPNIFRPRIDWNVISFNCKKYHVSDRFVYIISKTVKEETGFDPLCNIRSRKREFVQARQIFSMLLCKHTKRTLDSSGGLIGKHHATVLHSKKAVQNMIDTDKEFRGMYYNIESKVKQKLNGNGSY